MYINKKEQIFFNVCFSTVSRPGVLNEERRFCLWGNEISLSLSLAHALWNEATSDTNEVPCAVLFPCCINICVLFLCHPNIPGSALSLSHASILLSVPLSSLFLSIFLSSALSFSPSLTSFPSCCLLPLLLALPPPFCN